MPSFNKWLGLLLVLGMVTAMAWFRLNDFRASLCLPNVEASYHVLLTDLAYDETSAAEHLYSPILTLGAETDKFIPWHATPLSAQGNLIYTSFTPAGFVAPYLFFKLFSLSVTLEHLAWFNTLLGALTALLLYWQLCNFLEYLGKSAAMSAFCSLCAVTIAVFSYEVLVSHGVIYWAHSLYQPFLVITFGVFFRWLTQDSPRTKSLWIQLFLVTLGGGLIEWSAFFVNAGFIVVLWLKRDEIPEARRAIRLIIIATLLAGVLIIVYFSAVLGLQTTVISLFKRFYNRSPSAPGIAYLLIKGYGVSFGFFLLVLFGLLIVQLFKPALLDGYEGKKRLVLSSMLLAVSLPMLENVALLGHASYFSFDRLKLLFPFAYITAILLASYTRVLRGVFVTLLLVASVQSVLAYRNIAGTYVQWSEVNAQNEKLRDAIASAVDPREAIYYSNSWSSCYSMTLFHKNLFSREKNDPDFAFGKEMLEKRQPKAVVFLEAGPRFVGREGDLWLAVYRRATVLFADGTKKVFDLDELEKTKP